MVCRACGNVTGVAVGHPRIHGTFHPGAMVRLVSTFAMTHRSGRMNMVMLANTGRNGNRSGRTFYSNNSRDMHNRNNCMNRSGIPHLGILSLRHLVHIVPGPIVTVIGNCTVNNNRMLRVMYSLAVTSRGTGFNRANPHMNSFSTNCNTNCLTHVVNRGHTHRM